MYVFVSSNNFSLKNSSMKRVKIYPVYSLYTLVEWNQLSTSKYLHSIQIFMLHIQNRYLLGMSYSIVIYFRFAKYLEVMNLPDDFREILDEYLDASERSVGQKECHEFFDCPYSLKDSIKRNFYGNSL